MFNKQATEKGQALVFVTLGFVVLLGFVALAIDGGMVYSDRRHAQNASDASSLAGGGTAALSLENSFVTYSQWDCADTRVINAMREARLAAIARADSNRFAIDEDISDLNGVETECDVFDNGSYVDKYIDVTVVISTTTQTSFAQFFYQGGLRSNVEAVTRVRPRMPLAFGHAIVAVRQDCPNMNTGGVHFDGNNQVTVIGGGIFSNACLIANGNVDVDVTDGNITCIGDNCHRTNGNPSVSPEPGEGTFPLPPSSYEIPPPDCSSVPNRGSHNGSGTIFPGRYTQIRVNNNQDLVMERGLYCVGDFRINGGSVTGGNAEGDGVTIYITTGDFDMTGGSVNLFAPPARNCDYCPPPIPGVLIYMDRNNTGEISLLGNNSSQYMGLIYAPSGTIEVGGTAGEISRIHAQLIGDTVFIHGNAEVFVNFDDQLNYQKPAALELFR